MFIELNVIITSQNAESHINLRDKSSFAMNAIYFIYNSFKVIRSIILNDSSYRFLF